MQRIREVQGFEAMPDVLPLRLCARERQCGVILCVFSKFKI